MTRDGTLRHNMTANGGRVSTSDILETGTSTLQRSEIISPRCNGRGVSNSCRVMTFDEIFQEKFIPLDSRKKVGDYIIGRTIGEGTFSKVRLGKHVTTGVKVAIKVLPKTTILKKHDVRRRLTRETRALRKIAHDNIVRLTDVMETASNYYLVMDLIHGENLKHYLSKRPRLGEDESRDILRQVAQAVHHMHTLGIVHRDLKPDNFILESNERLKIVDFGLSAVLREGDTMTTQCGSPAYAAPEIFNNVPYTAAVDTWSMGVILYLMVTGGLPFTVEGRSYRQLYSVILRGYDVPTHVSTDCQDVLSRLLEVSPAHRISDSDLAVHPWMRNLT